MLGFISTSKNSKKTICFEGNAILTIHVDETVKRDEEFDFGCTLSMNLESNNYTPAEESYQPYATYNA